MTDTELITNQQHVTYTRETSEYVEVADTGSSDYERAQRIISAISEHPRLRHMNIRAEVLATRVILRGDVESYDDFTEAEELAKQACSGCRVINQLVVTPTHNDVKRNDDELGQRVREVLRRQDPDGLAGVDVKVQGGVVTLQGVVTETAQRILAEGLAVGVPGVRRLRNQILLVPEATDENQRLVRCVQKELSGPFLQGVDLPVVKVSDGRLDIRGRVPDPAIADRLLGCQESTTA